MELIVETLAALSLWRKLAPSTGGECLVSEGPDSISSKYASHKAPRTIFLYVHWAIPCTSKQVTSMLD